MLRACHANIGVLGMKKLTSSSTCISSDKLLQYPMYVKRNYWKCYCVADLTHGHSGIKMFISSKITETVTFGIHFQ